MITIKPKSLYKACRELHVTRMNPRHRLEVELFAVITPHKLYIMDWDEPTYYRSTPLSGQGSGEYAIYAVTLRDLAHVCDEVITIDQQGNKVVVRSGNCRFELKTLPLSEFPPRERHVTVSLVAQAV